MQPWFETVEIPKDRSWLLFDRQLPEFPFNWHYHPEFELTLTLNSQGMRFVGDHVERYDDVDLVLLGPNLPHAWQSETVINPTGAHRAIVCWFTRDWIDSMVNLVPELADLRPLLETASRGIKFSQKAREEARTRLLHLVTLPAEKQVFELLGLLSDLRHDRQSQTLAAGEMAINLVPRDRLRIEKVLHWLHKNHTQPLRLEPIAAMVHLSISQLQRLFKRSTRMSISDYVTQLRIRHACQLLTGSDKPIGHIATDVGFWDTAHFTRHFRASKGMSASQYRKLFQPDRAA